MLKIVAVRTQLPGFVRTATVFRRSSLQRAILCPLAPTASPLQVGA